MFFRDEELNAMEIEFEDFESEISRQNAIQELFEKYISITNQLKADINVLKQELNRYKKIHGELSDSLDEFRAIQKSSEIIGSYLDFNKIAQALLQLSKKIIQFSAADIFLKEENEWKPILNTDDPAFNIILNNLIEEGIIGWIWTQKQTIVVPIQELLRSPEVELKTGTLVISPLVVNHQGLGVYILFTQKEQPQFSLRDLELIQFLAQQTAIAIQYTRLYKNLENTHLNLKNSQTKLMQAIKLATVGELAGGIAHEINNPLQIILGKIQIAKLKEKDSELFSVLETQAMRIANIVRGLLTLARDSHKERKEYIDVNPVIQSTIDLVKGQLQKRNIEIDFQPSQNLPILVGNSVSLQQIFLNFLLTAKGQMSQGGKLQIVTESPDNLTIKISFTDDGHPLPEEVIKEALHPFSEPSEIKKDLHNLGLIVSVQIIRELGGTVQISASEEGNQIVIEIPRTPDEEINYGMEAANSA